MAGSSFEFQTRWAVEPLDLLRELRWLKPTVVHFSGHGGRASPASACRGKPSGEMSSTAGWGNVGGHASGLFFQTPGGRPQLVSAAAITETFGAAGSSVKLVVLSACYTEVQAEALLAHVDCVIGMGGSIRDDAARSFAIGFYGGLGAREPVVAAYYQGRAAIRLEGMPDSELPRLKVRAGVDAERLVLARASTAVHPPEPHPLVRQIRAMHYVEQLHGNRIIHLPPDTTEQEREARRKGLERTWLAKQDALYRTDPLMTHRHSEAAVLQAAVAAIAVVGALMLVLGQLPSGLTDPRRGRRRNIRPEESYEAQEIAYQQVGCCCVHLWSDRQLLSEKSHVSQIKLVRRNTRVARSTHLASVLVPVQAHHCTSTHSHLASVSVYSGT